MEMGNGKRIDAQKLSTMYVMNILQSTEENTKIKTF